MPRIKSTLFRPILGASYIVVNTKTKENFICHVLNLCDIPDFGPIRSGRACKRGNEFFKVYINDAVHKMNNCLDVGTCLSEDRNWEFTGERPTAGAREARKKENSKSKKQSLKKTPDIEFVSIKALSKIK